ncbi:uncharacterized protein LOC111705305 [Eurytemora carolleeae]|uniref:uncharacterized protein LOC111705305 n=1 Tax=Eurytemora carolleeae TaxID=1294199 RepID=UPI000C789F03|nr:uncharacterized protein LOC111705305 [Eurytemora carolleeae]|eukprot:XP_023333576.1 uncharacterized protein LOC111705305 [Eurytemora affinis]
MVALLKAFGEELDDGEGWMTEGWRGLEDGRMERNTAMDGFKFISKDQLEDANLVCGISRVESMLQEEDTEGLKSARGLLMEIYGKIENLNFDLERTWHAELLKTVIHLYQGIISMHLGELPNTENELKD